MKTLILPAALLLALLVSTTASARPIYDPVVSTPTPAVAHDHGDGAVGYILVGLGGLALGAVGVGVTQRGLRARAAVPARPSPDPAR